MRKETNERVLLDDIEATQGQLQLMLSRSAVAAKEAGPLRMFSCKLDAREHGDWQRTNNDKAFSGQRLTELRAHANEPMRAPSKVFQDALSTFADDDEAASLGPRIDWLSRLCNNRDAMKNCIFKAVAEEEIICKFNWARQDAYIACFALLTPSFMESRNDARDGDWTSAALDYWEHCFEIQVGHFIYTDSPSFPADSDWQVLNDAFHIGSQVVCDGDWMPLGEFLARLPVRAAAPPRAPRQRRPSAALLAANPWMLTVLDVGEKAKQKNDATKKRAGDAANDADPGGSHPPPLEISDDSEPDEAPVDPVEADDILEEFRQARDHWAKVAGGDDAAGDDFQVRLIANRCTYDRTGTCVEAWAGRATSDLTGTAGRLLVRRRR